MAYFVITGAKFRSICSRLKPIVSKDRDQASLQQILLDVRPDKLRCYATNGYVLGCQECTYEQAPVEAEQAGVAPDNLFALKPLVGKGDHVHVEIETAADENGEITVAVKFWVERRFAVSFPGAHGFFPDIDALRPTVPDDGGSFLTVSRDVLLSLAKAKGDGNDPIIHLHLLSKEGASPVPVAMDDGFWGIAMPIVTDPEIRRYMLSPAEKAPPSRGLEAGQP